MRIVMRKELGARTLGGGGGGRGSRNWGKRTVENFILTHAVRVPVTAEADDNEAVLF